MKKISRKKKTVENVFDSFFSVFLISFCFFQR